MHWPHFLDHPVIMPRMKLCSDAQFQVKSSSVTFQNRWLFTVKLVINELKFVYAAFLLLDHLSGISAEFQKTIDCTATSKRCLESTALSAFYSMLYCKPSSQYLSITTVFILYCTADLARCTPDTHQFWWCTVKVNNLIHHFEVTLYTVSQKRAHLETLCNFVKS